MSIAINISKNYSLAKLLTNLERAGEDDVLLSFEEDSEILSSRSNLETIIAFAKEKNITLELKSEVPALQEKIDKILSKELVTRERDVLDHDDNIVDLGNPKEEIKEVSLKNSLGNGENKETISKDKPNDSASIPVMANVLGLFGSQKKETDSSVEGDQKKEDKAEDESLTKEESNEDSKPSDKENEKNNAKDENKGLSFTELANKTNTQKDRKLSKLLLKIFLGLLLIGLIGVISFLTFLWYVPKSVIEIQTNSNSLVKIINVSADAAQAVVNLESNIIPAFQVSVSDTIQDQIDTNGTKTVGEKALGEVTIVNPLKQAYEIDKGTRLRVFKDKNGEVVADNTALEFVLQKAVTIPAAQEQVETQDGLEVQTTIVSGQVVAPVEANDIGEIYNLDPNYTFKIVGFNKTEVTVKNTKKFAGGSTREIKVVGDQDRDALLDIAKTKLMEVLDQKIKQKIVLGQNLNDSSINYEIIKQLYSHEAGDETDKLKIDLDMRATGIAYKDSEIERIVENLLPTFVPESYDLKNGEYEYDVKVISSDEVNQTAELQVKVNTFITPDIDLDKIKTDLLGLSMAEAQNYLNQLKDVKYTISLTPSFLNKLPRNINNLEISVKNE